MIYLSSTDIEQVVYDLLKGSGLESAISGKIYKSEMRPFNSTNEDVVITFLSGLISQVQAGIVVINTYVPDTLIDGHGYKATTRCKELEVYIKTG